MTTPPVDRAIVDALAEGPAVLPRAAYAAVSVGIRQTRQLGSFRLRLGRMAMPGLIAAGVGVAVVVAAAGLIPRNSPGQAGGSPTGALPTASSSAAQAVPELPNARLAAGAYRVVGLGAFPDGAPMPQLIIAVDQGWRGEVDRRSPPAIEKPGVAQIVFVAFSGLDVGDHDIPGIACGASYSPGPWEDATVDSVLAYLSNGRAGEIVDVVVGGRSGKAHTETHLSAADRRCPGDPVGPQFDPATSGRLRTTTIAVDVDGTIVVIGITRWADAAGSVEMELADIVASVRFEEPAGVPAQP